MKVLLVLLLGTILCLDSGSSLQCYSCSLQVSNSKCNTKDKIVNCKNNETCKTDVIKVGFLKLISKSCDASCSPSYHDNSVSSRNVTCCRSDNCNVNAAGSVRSSYGMAAGLVASILWSFLNNRL
ncbi:prostate stem cell antigen [Apus apus]|uniref:prostate stem cell antigen n=1 Tax=Apus apus TaxID=8895 RepID=UPI0021F90206|nr:prostate stem cell antigen [Apus apus]